MSARLRVFIACSLDGFIAGPDDDLSWLPEPPEGSDEDYGWSDFIAEIGCHLMGRRTYDVVQGMDVPWPYAERPAIIATRRSLEDPPPNVTASQGPIADLVKEAKERAGDKDVYIDGGELIRQALDARLIDEIIVTLIPTILGAGHPFFAGAEQRHMLELRDERRLPGGLVQLTYVPEGSDPIES